jgi:outer membrane protein assembly factor BamD
MNKKIILFFSVFSLVAVSCHNEEKVYESTNAKSKHKRFDVTIGKFNKLVKSSDMDAKYAAAKKYFDKEDYTKALTLFEELMSVYRGTEKGEEVQYYYAYCNYNLNDFIIAGYQFHSFAKNYPNSKHTEECAYMNAYCLYLNSPDYTLDQTDTKMAIKEFQRFTNSYPKSNRIALCNDILDKLRGKLEHKSYDNSMLYYRMGDYKACVVAFGNHLKDFPDTKYREELSFLTIKLWYLLALNSIEAKKAERFKASVDAYIKFIDAFPQSKYASEAESVYLSALQDLEKYNKPS